MEYKTYPENKTLCLTPEHKIKRWIEIIHQTAQEGNMVKLYSDTETTGFDHGPRGRGIYDPLMDKKSLQRDSMSRDIPFPKLEKEAKELAGKIDRMIEIALVACYTNKNGETYPLLDDDGEQIYFHEMISPYKDVLMPENKKLKSMPLIPYDVHKTSFDFLKGEETHPFLGIKLPHEAPGTLEVFSYVKKIFDYEDDKIFDNIIVLFHNANDFDVPFINSELSRLGEEFSGMTMRDYSQVFDTLVLIKQILPNPVQKLIAFSQWEEIYGGDPEIKKDKTVAINGTQKNLDNLIRLARFLPDLDLNKAYDYQENKQSEFAGKMKSAALKSQVKLWDNILEYFNSPNVELDLSDGADKEFIKNNKSVFDDYKKFKDGLKAFNSHMQEVKSYGQVFDNLVNLQENIKINKDLQTNIECIKSIGREAHGAKVDSMLFMYAFTIIENSLYKNQKKVFELKFENEGIALPEEALNVIKKKSQQPIVDSESTKNAIMKLSEKYEDDSEKKDNKMKMKI